MCLHCIYNAFYHHQHPHGTPQNPLKIYFKEEKSIQEEEESIQEEEDPLKIYFKEEKSIQEEDPLKISFKEEKSIQEEEKSIQEEEDPLKISFEKQNYSIHITWKQEVKIAAKQHDSPQKEDKKDINIITRFVWIE